jgi:hypothetical protein
MSKRFVIIDGKMLQNAMSSGKLKGIRSCRLCAGQMECRSSKRLCAESSLYRVRTTPHNNGHLHGFLLCKTYQGEIREIGGTVSLEAFSETFNSRVLAHSMSSLSMIIHLCPGGSVVCEGDL